MKKDKKLVSKIQNILKNLLYEVEDKWGNVYKVIDEKALKILDDCVKPEVDRVYYIRFKNKDYKWRYGPYKKLRTARWVVSYRKYKEEEVEIISYKLENEIISYKLENPEIHPLKA